MARVLRTDDSIAPLFLRLGLGSYAMLFGGTCLAVSGMAEGAPSIAEPLAQILLVPVFLSIPVIVVLTLGGLLLVLGWFVRAIASLTALAMVLPRLCSETGLLWSDEGWAFFTERIGFYLLALAAGIALSITGGGRLSADRMLIKQ
jgi:uncharacterized membrane protein YphA (DoxX/SURF4 family)